MQYSGLNIRRYVGFGLAALAMWAATVVPTTMASPAALSPDGPPPASTPAASQASPAGISRLEDTDPGPPFTIQVDAIRLEGGVYKVSGLVRNDGDQTYEGIGVLGTFYVSKPQGEGMAFPGRPGQDVPQPSNPEAKKKALWAYGPIQARCPCAFLEPGATCAFSLEIHARDYTAYRLHPTGQPLAHHTWHEAASVTVSGLGASSDGVGNIRITGKVSNQNTFTVKSITIGGALLDANGGVVSEGVTVVLGGIEPGGSASFDLRIKYAPYARYKLYVQGVRY